MSRPRKDSNQAPGYRARFVVVFALFSVFLSGIGLGLGERILREERASSVREVNAANVMSLASEVGVTLRAAADRLKLLARIAQPEELAEKLKADPDIVSVTVYSPTSRADYWEPRQSAVNPDFSKLYGFTPKSLDKLRRAIPVPFARVVAAGAWLSSAAADADAPLATLAIALDSDSVAVADLKTDMWAARLTRADEKNGWEVFLVDSRGNALAHPELRAFSRPFSAGDPPLARMPLVKHALEAPGHELASEYFQWDGRAWFGAAGPAGFAGVWAVSEVPESAAFQGVERFRRHAALLALLGITLAAFGAAWLVREPGAAVDIDSAPTRARAAMNEEFLELLLGIRARIEQIRTRAAEPIEVRPSESSGASDPELLRAALLECGKRLEHLGEQAAWAAEIFRKLSRTPKEPLPAEGSSHEAHSAD